MKQLTPTNLIAVEVSEDAVNCRFYIEGTLFVDLPNEKAKIIGNFSGGNYTILGEVTKEGVQFDVEPYLEFINGVNDIGFRNYQIITMCATCKTARESFQSLLQANNVEIPEGKKLLILLKQ